MERNFDDNMDEKLQHFGIVFKHRVFFMQKILYV
jgi:hypothetical protein